MRYKMTEQQWLNTAELNKQKLILFVRAWHPRSGQVQSDMKITAPNAELARANVVKSIQSQNQSTLDPVVELETAIKNRNLSAINALLNQAWFGVPESTSCWGIEGFKEAVELMEDLPYEDEEEEFIDDPEVNG